MLKPQLFEQDLFDNGAIFSPCRKYRYALWRIWDDKKQKAMFIGLNPSTANESKDDPTIRRIKGLVSAWGFGGFYMVNLFGWITPYPEELQVAKDPVGETDDWIKLYSGQCSKIIAAWGDFPEARDRAAKVLKMIGRADALIINQGGTPRHPLYVPKNTVPIPFYPSK